MSNFIANELDLDEVRLVLEDAVLDVANGVVAQRNRFETDRKRHFAQSLDQVGACVQRLEVEAALEVVVVAQLFDLVVVDVQPLQAHWNESVVEPQEPVGRNVEPLQAGEGGHETVDVCQEVVVQPESSQVFQSFERSLLDFRQLVVSQVEDVDGGGVLEGSALDR